MTQPNPVEAFEQEVNRGIDISAHEKLTNLEKREGAKTEKEQQRNRIYTLRRVLRAEITDSELNEYTKDKEITPTEWNRIYDTIIQHEGLSAAEMKGELGIHDGKSLKKFVWKGSKKIEKAERVRQALDVDEYFGEDQELREYYQWMREEFLRELGEFKREAKKEGDKTFRSLTKELQGDFEQNIDQIMLTLFELINLKDIPAVRQRLLDNKYFPDIKVTSLFEMDRFMSLEEATIVPRGQRSEIRMLDFLTSENNEYIEVKETLIHGFLHSFLQSFDMPERTNTALEESVTELLTEKTVEHRDEVYANETRLATALFQLDHETLLNWYVGGHKEDFVIQLEEKLKLVHGDEAKQIAEQVIFLEEDISELREKAQEEITAKLRPLIEQKYPDKNIERNNEFISTLAKFAVRGEMDFVGYVLYKLTNDEQRTEALLQELEALARTKIGEYYRELTAKIQVAIANNAEAK